MYTRIKKFPYGIILHSTNNRNYLITLFYCLLFNLSFLTIYSSFLLPFMRAWWYYDKELISTADWSLSCAICMFPCNPRLVQVFIWSTHLVGDLSLVCGPFHYKAFPSVCFFMVCLKFLSIDWLIFVASLVCIFNSSSTDISICLICCLWCSEYYSVNT